ncbi:uncharacterized protein LOC111133364 isoform X2 [Crassostrea virginica]
MERENMNCSGQLQYHLRRMGPATRRPHVVNIMDFYKTISVIGRNGLMVDFYISSEDKTQSRIISRCHAKVVLQPNNDHKLFDESLTGVFVNHVKIEGSVILREGDLVTFGHPQREIPYGAWECQINSQHQFIFEKCHCIIKSQPKKKKRKILCATVSKDRISSTMSKPPTTAGVTCCDGLSGTPEKQDEGQSMDTSQGATLIDSPVGHCLVTPDREPASHGRSEDLRMPYINKEASCFWAERNGETFSTDAAHVDNYVVGPRLKPQHKQPNRHKDIGTHGEKEETVTNSPSSRGLCNTKEEMEEENAEASSDATFSSDSENDHGESGESSDWAMDMGVHTRDSTQNTNSHHHLSSHSLHQKPKRKKPSPSTNKRHSRNKPFDEDMQETSTKTNLVPISAVNRTSDSWKLDCLTLLETIFQCNDSSPFRFPVDRDELPEYFDIIEHPMDLSTVKENLLSDRYSNPNSLFKDLCLIFSNSCTFNTNNSSIYAMTRRLSAMVKEKRKKIMSDWSSAVQHEKKLAKQRQKNSQGKSVISRRSQSYRMAPTGVPSDVCTGSLHCGAGSYTAGTMATPHSDELALTREKEDHQPVKAKTSSPRKRLDSLLFREEDSSKPLEESLSLSGTSSIQTRKSPYNTHMEDSVPLLQCREKSFDKALDNEKIIEVLMLENNGQKCLSKDVKQRDTQSYPASSEHQGVESECLVIKKEKQMPDIETWEEPICKNNGMDRECKGKLSNKISRNEKDKVIRRLRKVLEICSKTLHSEETTADFVKCEPTPREKECTLLTHSSCEPTPREKECKLMTHSSCEPTPREKKSTLPTHSSCEMTPREKECTLLTHSSCELILREKECTLLTHSSCEPTPREKECTLLTHSSCEPTPREKECTLLTHSSCELTLREKECTLLTHSSCEPTPREKECTLLTHSSCEPTPREKECTLLTHSPCEWTNREEGCTFLTNSSSSSFIFTPSDLICTFDIDPDNVTDSAKQKSGAGETQSTVDYRLCELDHNYTRSVGKSGADQTQSTVSTVSHTRSDGEYGALVTKSQELALTSSVRNRDRSQQTNVVTNGKSLVFHETVPPIKMGHQNFLSKDVCNEQKDKDIKDSGNYETPVTLSASNEVESHLSGHNKCSTIQSVTSDVQGNTIDMLEHRGISNKRKRKTEENGNVGALIKKKKLLEEEVMHLKNVVSNFFRIREFFEKQKDRKKSDLRKDLIGNLVKHFFKKYSFQTVKMNIRAGVSFMKSLVFSSQENSCGNNSVVTDRDSNNNNNNSNTSSNKSNNNNNNSKSAPSAKHTTVEYSDGSVKREPPNDIMEISSLSQASPISQPESFPVYQTSVKPCCGIVVNIGQSKGAVVNRRSLSESICDVSTQTNSLEIDMETTNPTQINNLDMDMVTTNTTQTNSLDIDLETSNTTQKNSLGIDPKSTNPESLVLTLEGRPWMRENEDSDETRWDEEEDHQKVLSEEDLDSKTSEKSYSSDSNPSHVSELLLQKVSSLNGGIEEDNVSDVIHERKENDGHICEQSSPQRDSTVQMKGCDEDSFCSLHSRSSDDLGTRSSDDSHHFSAEIIDSSNDLRGLYSGNSDVLIDSHDTLQKDWDDGSAIEDADDQKKEYPSDDTGEGVPETGSQGSEWGSDDIEIISTKSTSDSELEDLYGKVSLKVEPDHPSLTVDSRNSRPGDTSLSIKTNVKDRYNKPFYTSIKVKPSGHSTSEYPSSQHARLCSDTSAVTAVGFKSRKQKQEADQKQSSLLGLDESCIEKDVHLPQQVKGSTEENVNIKKEHLHSQEKLYKSRLPEFESDSDVEIRLSSDPVLFQGDIPSISLSFSSSDDLPEVTFLKEEACLSELDKKTLIKEEPDTTCTDTQPNTTCTVKCPPTQPSSSETTAAKATNKSSHKKKGKKRVARRESSPPHKKNGKASSSSKPRSRRSLRRRSVVKRTIRLSGHEDSDVDIVTGSESEGDFTPSKLPRPRRGGQTDSDSDM